MIDPKDNQPKFKHNTISFLFWPVLYVLIMIFVLIGTNLSQRYADVEHRSELSSIKLISEDLRRRLDVCIADANKGVVENQRELIKAHIKISEIVSILSESFGNSMKKPVKKK